MLVYTQAEDNAPRSAVKIRYEASRGETASPLVLDHCTVAVGEGSLFDVEGIRGDDPFAFQVKQTVVRAGALLLWRPPPAEFPKAMNWSGEGNRYDVRKPYWVVLPPTGLDGLPNGPTDQDSWEAVEGVEEQDLQTITAQWANPARVGVRDPRPGELRPRRSGGRGRGRPEAGRAPRPDRPRSERPRLRAQPSLPSRCRLDWKMRRWRVFDAGVPRGVIRPSRSARLARQNGQPITSRWKVRYSARAGSRASSR